MSPEADALLEVVLKKVALRDGFSPAELGARVGLSKIQANAAARALANAGVLVIGFDNSAEFSEDYRRANTVLARVSPKKKRRGGKAAAAGKQSVMPDADVSPIPDAASEPSLPRLGFDNFLAKLSARDRTNVLRRIAAAADAPSDGGLLELWRRLAGALFTLAPCAPRMSSRQAVQYFVADGRYRMQAFALEDLQDGNVTVYCPDVLSKALTAGVVAAPPAGGDDDVYAAGKSEHRLTITLLDRSTIDPAVYFKDMVGLNRRAMRITLPAAASAPQVAAAESLCAIAAERFYGTTGPVA